MEMRESLFRVASEARNRRRTEEGGSNLLEIWENVLMVGQSTGSSGT